MTLKIGINKKKLNLIVQSKLSIFQSNIYRKKIRISN